ncbi:MAG: rubrerythrin family protein [Candidatus Wallbacteria bacterium]
MKKMTETFLKEAFAGESQAHMKYKAFAKEAKEKGLNNIAKLFEAIAYAEEVHATGHLRVLGGIKTTSENLQAAHDGEGFEIDEMYPAYKAVAELQNEKAAAHVMGFALEAEKIHKKMYADAKHTVDGGKDIAPDTIHVCSVCGHTVAGNAPDECPVCHAKKDKFKAF